MNPQPLTSRNRQTLRRATYLGAWISTMLSATAATTFTGNHTIAASTTPTPEEGNLNIAGHFGAAKGLDVGITTISTINYSAINLDWRNTAPFLKTASLDLSDSLSSFQWRDNFVGGDATARSKMKLDSTNALSLFKSDGSAPGITFDPTAGSITLAGLNSGIYNSTGSPMVSFSSTGVVTFPTRPLFSNGIDFGSGKVLNNSNVGHMQGLMANFGYQENPVIGTPVKKINLIGNIGVTSTVASGSNLYLAGFFRGTATIGTSSVFSAGLTDGFVAKLDANGSTLWAVPIGGLLDDWSTSISIDVSGNVFVGGNFNGVTTNLWGINITSAGSTDGYIAKLNSSGAFQWAKPIGGTLSEAASSISVDSGGNVLVVGNFAGTTTSLVTNISSAGSNDGYVGKWDPNGVEQWVRPIGGSLYDYATSVAVDGSNNVLVAGVFDIATTNLVGIANILSAGSNDGYVAKFNASGIAQWARPIGGGSYDGASSVTADSSGNVIVGGSFTGTTTNLAMNIPSAGTGDGFVAAWNTSGVGQWAKALGGPSNDSVSAVRVENSNTILVAGNFSGTTTNLTPNITSAGLQDGFHVRLAANGNSLNAQPFGGLGDDSVFDVIPWGSEFYVRGSAASNGTFALGNTRIPPGPFLVGLPLFNINTPTVLPSVQLAWGGSAALGVGSTALGGNAFAEGSNSVALGSGVSLGSSSLSFGTGRALASNSIALGTGMASGTSSITLGAGIASGASSFAVGTGEASGWNSFAMGVNSKASGRSSFAGGSFSFSSLVTSQVSGNCSFAWGSALTASGAYSQTFGSWNSVPANNASAFGTRLIAQSHNSFALGRYNIIQGDPINWVPSDDLFVIGNGDTAASLSNAVKTLKNGQTTLTNKEWKANPTVPPSLTNSNAEALVVEGHSVLKGNTILKGETKLEGKVIISAPQGDISMGIYQ